MSIPKNAAVAVVGPSGAGKTTLIDIIAGILQPTQGAVYVDQQELSKLDLRRYRQCLGYVGQDTMLFDDTIANNIRMQWDDWIDPLTLDRIREAARASYCDEFIQDLPEGFNTRIGEHGIQLSGGQRQRLAIARELFKNPQVLILDEATSSLDSESETYIQQSIEHLKGALTLVIISHRLSTIRHVDTIYVIQQGHIVEQGTFTVLRHQPGTTFHQMCELQMGPGQNRS
jgi:subfamily B ATP-binding cassette protein MsbA